MPLIAEYDCLTDMVEFAVTAESVVTCTFAFAILVSHATSAL